VEQVDKPSALLQYFQIRGKARRPLGTSLKAHLLRAWQNKKGPAYLCQAGEKLHLQWALFQGLELLSGFRRQILRLAAAINNFRIQAMALQPIPGRGHGLASLVYIQPLYQSWFILHYQF
jgi:hypothetical protein